MKDRIKVDRYQLTGMGRQIRHTADHMYKPHLGLFIGVLNIGRDRLGGTLERLGSGLSRHVSENCVDPRRHPLRVFQMLVEDGEAVWVELPDVETN